MKTKLIILFAIVFTSISTFAQQATFQDSLLEKMIGTWTLKGVIAGQETTHDVTFSWILNHQYLQFHEISREKNAYNYSRVSYGH